MFGIQKNQLDQLRKYFTHSHKFLINNSFWDFEISYETDHKQQKFISKEKSLILKISPEDSHWKLKLEGT